MLRIILFSLLGIFLVACDGVIGGSSGKPRSGPSAELPGQATMLRMTKEQHQSALGDLLQHFLGSRAPAVLNAIQPLYGIVPNDSSEVNVGGLVGATFSRMSQNVDELHVLGYYDIATVVADEIIQDDISRSVFFGDCIDQPLSDHKACIEAFVDSVGLWTSRRPLEDDERDFLVDTVFANDGSDYQATPTAIRDLLIAMLASPRFLYIVEDHGDEVEDGVDELDAYELASRLSFHFWNSMPDQELFSAAANGSLLDETEYEAQVARIYSDPRTQATFQKFFFEWLELYRVGDPFSGVQSGDLQKMVFIEGADVTPQLVDNMVNEVLDMTEYYRLNGAFADLFTSNVSFARTADLASIYGVPAWNGSMPLVQFPTPDRLGLLGRGALLSASTVYTHPILRGVRIREDFMCDELGMPPADFNGSPTEATAMMTTRERISALTSSSSCIGCHQFINGLGFPLESFDALGRHRDEEMIIDPMGGVVLAPLDVDATPFTDSETDATIVSGPAGLVDDLLQSGKLQSCFARHYARFTLGLAGDPDFRGDSDVVDALAQQIDGGAPLADVFKGIAFLPAFKQRLRGDQ